MKLILVPNNTGVSVVVTINSLSGIVVYAHWTASVAKFMTSCLCLLRDIMLLTIEWSISAMGM